MAGRKRSIPPETVERIGELREQGWSHKRIAGEVGCSPGGVQYICLRECFLSPHQRPATTPARSIKRGKTRQQRTFSRAEDERLLALEAECRGNESEIARRMGRKRTSVRLRLMWLAQREALLERDI